MIKRIASLLLIAFLPFIMLCSDKVKAEQTPIITIELGNINQESYLDYQKRINDILDAMDELSGDNRVVYCDYAVEKNIYTDDFRIDSSGNITFKGGIEVTGKNGQVVYSRIGGPAVTLNGDIDDLHIQNWTLINEFQTNIVGVSAFTFYDLITGSSKLYGSSTTDGFHDGMVCMLDRQYASFIDKDGVVT